MSSDFIPFARPDIGDAEIAEVLDTLKSGWLTTGPKTRQFEQEFAERVGAKHAVAVNSGTAAMHLALEAAGVGPGDAVITTDYTFTATAEVVRYMGADPLFVDVDPETLNIDPSAVEGALRAAPNVKALIPVHFAGQACDMAELRRIATDHDLFLLEDAAHAFPATYRGECIGSIGDATAFSFYVTKTLAIGEGGMLTTDDDRLAERARTMRLHGINRDVFDRYTSKVPSWYYEVVAPGFKYNLTDVASSIGLHQLRRAESLRARRQVIAERYLDAFTGLPVKLPVPETVEDEHAWHLFVLQLDTEALNIDRDEFVNRMASEGIGTSVHFIPLHRQPYWRDRYQLSAEQFPVSEAVFESAVSLPLFSAMTADEIDRVVNAVTRIVAATTKR